MRGIFLWEDLSKTFKEFKEFFLPLFPGPPRTPPLWRSAFTHASFVYEHPEEAPNFERLEFLGDAMLYAATSSILYRLYPEYAESALSFLRMTLIRREVLAEFSERYGLHRWLRLGRSARSLDERGLETIYADLFEAFLGAYYLEFGWEKLCEFVEKEFLKNLPDVEEARKLWDPKSVLQERLAQAQELPPRYELIGREKEESRVLLFLKGMTFEGRGRNRKEAELDAARRALEYLDHSHGNP